ncbi:leader peptidase (prepilin peptidase)/N-methyltransferase [Kribbella orskensis]|uniref:Leader peptidase (Prepilin peptidase)/N-methyltransferase n=1 Tax=Kribbella orskensis TaxID=2512216 RepID=A0ABY2BNX4_9ACTN|nr:MULTISPECIES: A24 family peptidase [Kribbella]TCN42044.1 leader peptidase (prepilin peptidase)/N-methyltransferase [Kribbella sp. VKM Ac-2500]TCO25922.1 leader peptidase (prepilin peptidase)/N-methyltransferase [Kribbella orskensis]
MPADHALLAASAGVVLCGPAAYLLGPWLLRRIPEPILEEGETKPLYAELAGQRAAYWCGATAAVAGGLLGWSLGNSPALVAWLILAVVGSVLGYIDTRTRYLPSAIIWPSYLVVGLALVAGSAVSGEWGSLRRAAIAGVIGFGVFYVLWYVFPRGVGFGDVRLSGLLSMALGWLGWGELVTGLYGGFFLGAVIGIVLTLAKVFKRRQLFPFGPFMLVGALVGVLVGGPLERLYLG